ncbi:hypothetical protein ACYX79_00650 [Stenotrophomonas rhizophila]
MPHFRAASYLPDMLVITLSQNFEPFEDPNDIKGFSTPEQGAIFVHEWMHYLHNLSTVAGVATFCTYLNIWNSFRHTIGIDGWSQVGAVTSPEIPADIERQFEFVRVLRAENRPVALDVQDPDPERVHFTSVELERVATVKTCELHLVKCKASYLPPHTDKAEQHQVTIGAHEIFEYVAVSLEDEVSRHFGAQMRRPSLAPYLLVSKLAEHVSPGLSKLTILKAALASLQHIDPPAFLMTVLQLAASEAKAGRDPDPAIHEAVVMALNVSSHKLKSSLLHIERMFPISEPMGDSIKFTIKLIRGFLARRQMDPFLELGILDRLGGHETCLSELFSLYSGPLFIQRRSGDADRPSRDLIHNYYSRFPNVSSLAPGWRWMHAALRFVGAHLIQKTMEPSELANEIRCPFYTVCDKDFRKDNPKVCREMPWHSVLSGSDTCDFAYAVHITRPPAAELGLAHYEPAPPGGQPLEP